MVGPLILFSTQNTEGIFKNKFINNFIFILVLLNLVLIQSTATIISVVFLLLLTLLYTKKINFHSLKFIFVIFSTVLILLIYIDPVIDKVIHLKGSGLIRAELNLYTLEIIVDNFLLGIGFGAHQNAVSLILFITVSLGIIGLLTWFYLIYIILKLKIHTSNRNDLLYYNGFKISFTAITFLTFISFSESLFVLPFYWLNIILIISLYIKYNRKKFCAKMEIKNKKLLFVLLKGIGDAIILINFLSSIKLSNSEVVIICSEKQKFLF